VIKKNGHKMKFSGRKYSKAEYWFDEECMLNKKETKMTLVEYKVKDDDVSRFKYWECRKEYYNILVKKKKSWQEKQSEFLNNLIKQKEVKKIWEAVRNILKKNYYLPTVTPEKWIKLFSDFFSNTAGEPLTYELQALGPQYVEELDKDFTEQEVKGHVIGVKNNKAVGFNGIPAEMWKIFSITNDGIKILTNLFNKVKNKNEFPSDWKVAIICPIYKGKGSPQEPGNYRGISLLSVLGKIFSGILAGRLRDWLSNHEVLSEFQAGFVKGKSDI
jgi:hypothetical protein